MKIHILILNFNGAELLRKNLPSFIEAVRSSKHECCLSIVDNQSADQSHEVVRSFGESVRWIPMKDNRVLCAYNEVARTLEDDILILMNNDIDVEPDFIDPLAEPFMSDSAVFFVTPRCFAKDRITYEGNRTKGAIRYGVFWATCLYPGYEKEAESFGLTLHGGYGAFDRKKFLELGGYDDLYLPGRLEDADICFRAHKKSWKCLYQPKSVVYHEGGVSFHKAFGVKKTLIINSRNTFLFMWKNLSDPWIFAQFFLWLPLRLVYSLVRLRPEIFLGFLQAVPMAGMALARRKKLKEGGLLNTIPDRLILNQI